MLSWSSTQEGHPADLAAIADGSGDGGLPFGAELIAFTDAIGGYDEAALEAARRTLVDAAGEPFMIDAAAVAANFEMMTRVADGTGARFPDDVVRQRAGMIGGLGIAGFTSAR
jgi:hypothetical protein